MQSRSVLTPFTCQINERCHFTRDFTRCPEDDDFLAAFVGQLLDRVTFPALGVSSSVDLPIYTKKIQYPRDPFLIQAFLENSNFPAPKI
jgi:hypothetical protein